jgi:hypothetical protein
MSVVVLAPPVIKLDANGALPIGYGEARLFAARAGAAWLNELPEFPHYATADFSIDLAEIMCQAFMQKVTELQGTRRR